MSESTKKSFNCVKYNSNINLVFDKINKMNSSNNLITIDMITAILDEQNEEKNKNIEPNNKKICIKIKEDPNKFLDFCDF